jgi:hypothetical protein
MGLAPVVNAPLPRQPEPLKPIKAPVEKVALTRSMDAASIPGVIVQLSPEVQWMQKNGII